MQIYNDTTSTTPDALIAALKALGNKNNIVLIIGGADKKLSMDRIYPYVMKNTKKIVCLPGTGTDNLLKEKRFANLQPIEALGMDDAVQKALAVSKSGDILLMSPAFASFGIFKNEFDRGDQFVQAVKKYV